MSDQPLSEPTKTNGRAETLLMVIAVAVLIGDGVLATAAIRSDATDIIGVEYAVTHPVQRLALGHPLYADPEAPPFSLIQYTPLHYQLSAALLRAIGGDPYDPATATRVGRIAAAAMWAGASVVVGGWLLRTGAGPAITLALVAWWTTASGVWWFLNRPDSAQTFLSFVSLALMARSAARGRISWPWLAAASLAGVAAGYAKQNGWFVSVVYVVFLFAARERRAAAGAVLLTIVAQLTLHGLAWRAWGSAWPKNILGALDNGVQFSRAVVMAFQPVAYEASAVLAVAAVIAWHSRRSVDRARLFLSLAFAILFALAAVAALKVGSAENYFIDSCGVAVLIVGVAVAAVRRNDSAGFTTAASVVAVGLSLYGPVKLYESWRRLGSASSYASFRPVGERLTRLLADKPGAWAFAPDGRIACFLPERTVLPQILLAELGFARGRFGYQTFEQLVAHGEVAVVVFPVDLPEDRAARPRLLGVSLADYHFVDAVGRWRFYVHDRYSD